MTDAGVLLLGYGLAGRVFHAPLIGATDGLSIRTVVTGNPERQEQARADLPGARIVADPEAALADLDGIDLVVVAGANRTHVPQALAAIAQGRHVVIDKPMAGTADDGRRIADAARAAGARVHPFQNRRWDSDFMTIVEVARSGILGTLHRFESRIERMRVQPRGNWRESADPADLGGVLLDFGAHLVDQALILMGPVVAVDARARAIRDPQGSDDDMTIVLEHSSGATSTLIGSQAAASGGPRFLLLGADGAVRIEGSDTQEAALRSGRSPRDANWGREDFTATVVTVGDGTLDDVARPLMPGRWSDFYPAVRDALSGSAGPVEVDDAIANLVVLDAARQSVASGQRIRLSPPVGHA